MIKILATPYTGMVCYIEVSSYYALKMSGHRPKFMFFQNF